MASGNIAVLALALGLTACHEKKKATVDPPPVASSAPAAPAEDSPKSPPATGSKNRDDGPPSNEKSTSTPAFPSQAHEPPPAPLRREVPRVSAQEFCALEKKKEDSLLEGHQFFGPWHSSCVIDGAVAWTKRLTSVAPGEVEEYRFRMVRYEAGIELASDETHDGEFVSTSPLTLFDALDSRAKEVFWVESSDGPEGDSWKSLRGLGMKNQRLTAIRTKASRLVESSENDFEVVVDTVLQDIRQNCESVHGSLLMVGLQLFFRRTKNEAAPVFALDRERLASHAEKECPQGKAIVTRYQGNVEIRPTAFMAHCALGRGAPLEDIEALLESVCKDAEYRESCSTPLPSDQCDGWSEVLSSLPEVSAWLSPTPPPLFEWAPPKAQKP